MKNLYSKLLALGIFLEINLLIFFDRKIVAYGPVIFWAIAMFGILHSSFIFFKLSSLVKKSKPELYKKHSFGFTISKNSIIEDKFLYPACLHPYAEKCENDEINEVYHILLENNDTLGHYGIYANGILTETITEKVYNKYFI